MKVRAQLPIQRLEQGIRLRLVAPAGDEPSHCVVAQPRDGGCKHAARVRVGRDLPAELGEFERGTHSEEWPALWEEMTEVRRSVPGAEW